MGLSGARLVRPLGQQSIVPGPPSAHYADMSSGGLASPFSALRAVVTGKPEWSVAN